MIWPMSQMTRIPSGLNEEDPFFVTSFIRLSLRQLLTIGGGLVIAYVIGKMVGGLLGVVWLGWLVGIPIFAVSILFAFRKKEGRHLELWIADRIVFMLDAREYHLGGSADAVGPRVIEVDFEEDRITSGG